MKAPESGGASRAESAPWLGARGVKVYNGYLNFQQMAEVGILLVVSVVVAIVIAAVVGLSAHLACEGRNLRVET